MAIVKMNRITLIGLEENQEAILERLMKLGVVEIENVQYKVSVEEWAGLVAKDGEDASVSELEAAISKVDSSIRYLEKYNSRKKALFEPKKLLTRSKYNEILNKEPEIWEVVNRISNYDDKLSSLKSEENRLRNHIATIEPWKALDVPLDFVSTKTSAAMLGVVPAIVDIEELKNQLNTEMPESFFEVVNSDKDQSYVFVVYLKSVEEGLLNILKQNGFTKVSFKDVKGTASENIDRAYNRIREIETERNVIEERISALSGEKENIEVLHDYLLIKRDRQAARRNMVKTGKSFMLEGWVPAEMSGKVEKEITLHFDTVIEIREAEEDEEFPILLNNPSYIKPFELITELYSLPSSKGIDPNIFMALFYFVFFGLMVSDAGYGLLMALATGFILYKFKPEGMANKLLRLLFFGGISTFIWGALFGGWFGDIVTLVSEMASGRSITIPPIWFNPMDDPMRLLIWSLVFGGVHLFVGMGIKAYMLIRDGHVLDAVFDIFSWYILLIGLTLMILGGTAGAVGKYMAIAGAVILVLTQGRGQKGVIKKFLSGVLSLYDVTGYLSDVLSYSRLLALGLATGVIASVINTVAVLFGFNVIGIILLVVIFIVGHVFNILINVLGAYVHASRLQYVEFFGKFYEGGGKSFQPFTIKTKYINLN
ncbi:MAG: V-type ATP synthase subunit I [Acetivibrionales bacterium]|jgi:V/A-type H+-transporting ATPase subunit I